MLVEDHEIVVRFDLLFDYDAQFTEISVDDRFDKIHLLHRCDDEAIAHVLSQLKKEHVVDALSCYDVLIFDNEHLRLVHHRA
jgi:hypothetical protein